MATLTVQKITAGLSGGTYSGVTPTYASATVTGDQFKPGNFSRAWIQVKNSGASTVVTVGSVKACDQGHDHDVAVTVGATSGDKIIPVDESLKDANGYVQITYSQVTGITIGAFELSDKIRG